MEQVPEQPTETPSPRGTAARRGGRRARSARGAWTIVAIFAVGGLVLAGLWLSPRAKPPAAPAGVPPGVPDVPLCFVTCDLRGKPHTVESALALVRSVPSPAADYVLFVGVDADEITDLAAGLGMQASYHPQLFQRAGKARGDKPVGVAILSRQPLYEGARIGTDTATAGVGAVSVVGGRRFLVACVDLDDDAPEGSTTALIDWARAAGATPVVVGGVLGMEVERVSRDAGLAVIAPGHVLLASPQWAGTEARTMTDRRGGKGNWAVVEPKATRPSSGRARQGGLGVTR